MIISYQNESKKTRNRTTCDLVMQIEKFSEVIVPKESIVDVILIDALNEQFEDIL